MEGRPRTQLAGGADCEARAERKERQEKGGAALSQYPVEGPYEYPTVESKELMATWEEFKAPDDHEGSAAMDTLEVTLGSLYP
ncbi:hypothetical protein E2C01_037094 [Portunus trituberculatus]|uniref:Uncharacterized protein n=1 Tax=Portunus trituberculatus TaxID=210409 RepID=A0A5B7FDQ2_PORTR|nr:hypothetical protein [Portunus trituberculatus]